MAEADGELPAGAGGEGGGDAAAAAYEPLANQIELPRLQDPRHSNVRFFHGWFGTTPLPPGRFRKIRTIAKAIYGKVELHKDEHNAGQEVVLKKVANTRIEDLRQQPVFLASNGGGGEDIVNEIGVLRRLGQPRCSFISQCIDIFTDGAYTYIALEKAGSEALASLQGAAGGEPMGQTDGDVLTYSWQLFLAAQYLHSRKIAHCDFSMENVMRSPDNRMVLIDFGGAVLCEDRDGNPLRHFAAIGKPFYRAPETYIPGQRLGNVDVVRPAGPAGSYAQVDIRQGNRIGSYLYEVVLDDSDRWDGDPNSAPFVSLELAGYDARRADLFALGVCMFILRYRAPPWKHAMLTDSGFRYILQHGVGHLLSQWHLDLMSPDAMNLMSSLLQMTPLNRPSAREALQLPVMHDARERNRALLGEHFREFADAAAMPDLL